MSADAVWGGVPEDVAIERNYAEQYRSLSLLAVASCALGLLGAANLLSYAYGMALGFIPLLGTFLGIFAAVRVRRRPQEFTGFPVAVGGALLSLSFLAAGWGYSGYVYATEVPPDHARINYELLQPDKNNPSELVPESAMRLDGQQVFIRGYAFQGTRMSNIKRFILCRDSGDCCFGGNPKLTDMILVDLVDPHRLTWSRRVQRIAGTFRVKPGQGVDGRDQILYQLENAQLR